jgi:hypothetical protein
MHRGSISASRKAQRNAMSRPGTPVHQPRLEQEYRKRDWRQELVLAVCKRRQAGEYDEAQHGLESEPLTRLVAVGFEQNPNATHLRNDDEQHRKGDRHQTETSILPGHDAILNVRDFAPIVFEKRSATLNLTALTGTVRLES